MLAIICSGENYIYILENTSKRRNDYDSSRYFILIKKKKMGTNNRYTNKLLIDNAIIQRYDVIKQLVKANMIRVE